MGSKKKRVGLVVVVFMSENKNKEIDVLLYRDPKHKGQWLFPGEEMLPEDIRGGVRRGYVTAWRLIARVQEETGFMAQIKDLTPILGVSRSEREWGDKHAFIVPSDLDCHPLNEKITRIFSFRDADGLRKTQFHRKIYDAIASALTKGNPKGLRG